YTLLLSLYHHTPPTQIYPLSLHDALPIFDVAPGRRPVRQPSVFECTGGEDLRTPRGAVPFPRSARDTSPQRGGSRVQRPPCHVRSEEHTSELQSLAYLVCRLLLEKKKHKI